MTLPPLVHFCYSLLGWCKALVNKEHYNAHRILYVPFSSQKLAICSSKGITIWNSESTASPSTRLWNIERTIKGNYSTISFSPDGRLLGLGSIYSSYISLYDLRKDNLYTLPGIHSTIKDLLWSSTGRNLIAVSTEAELRIYETESYTNTKWTGLGSTAGVLLYLICSLCLC